MIPTMSVVTTASIPEEPCCLPGYFKDDSDVTGECYPDKYGRTFDMCRTPIGPGDSACGLMKGQALFKCDEGDVDTGLVFDCNNMPCSDDAECRWDVGCPEGTTLNADRECCHIPDGQRVDFENAKNDCESAGGQIVSTINANARTRQRTGRTALYCIFPRKQPKLFVDFT